MPASIATSLGRRAQSAPRRSRAIEWGAPEPHRRERAATEASDARRLTRAAGRLENHTRGRCRSMITGFNTDVKYRGVVYHVQTEDKGTTNPMIETLIYKGGEILASRRLPYTELVKRPEDEPAITKLMEDQHKGMIMEIKRGRFESDSEQTVVEDLSLDEIVLAYLAARAAGH